MRVYSTKPTLEQMCPIKLEMIAILRISQAFLKFLPLRPSSKARFVKHRIAVGPKGILFIVNEMWETDKPFRIVYGSFAYWTRCNSQYNQCHSLSPVAMDTEPAIELHAPRER